MNIQKNQKEIEQYAGTYYTQGSREGMHGVVSGGQANYGTQSGSSVHKAGSRGYSVDFSGGFIGNQAYENQGKTIEDVMTEASASNAALQKDYMTIMSHTMSDEDFAKMSEEGYHPGKMEPGEMVTIVDEIKAELAEAGVIVVGYNDDIDSEVLKEITGSEVRAQAILDAFRQYDIPVTEKNVEEAAAAMDLAEKLSQDTEGMKKYLLENHLPPTIENLYRAAYSGSNDAGVQGRGYFEEATVGYYGLKAEQVDIDALKDSLAKVIEESGYEVNEETLKDAAWIVENGIPLTKETLAQMEKINEVTLPITEEQAAMAAARALQDGKTAKEADLSSEESLLERAVRVQEEALSVTEEAIDKVIEDGEELNLRNLAAAERELQNAALPEGQGVSGESGRQENIGRSGQSEESGNSGHQNNPGSSEQAVIARRQMEEVRLLMSVQVNYRMLKQGISIDTTELSSLVEDLKKAEREIFDILLGRSERQEDKKAAGADSINVSAAEDISGLFKDTLGKVRAIPGMPASILGELLKVNETEFSRRVTIDAVYETGLARQNAYAAAEEKYEPLMTAPRADYGDSMKKAFGNVDDLLKEMDLEVTESNRRAVRILGYNTMELSEENIQAVKEAYSTVSRVIGKMTPAAVLDLIREGSNPLNMSMEELENRLASRDSSPMEEAEKYSRYLYRLEQNHEISQGEKESYIGIYRMLHQIEKRDGAAVGSLIHQGAEINFKNLLTAVRNHNRTGMDYSIDDDFGALNGALTDEGYRNSITKAIETAYNGRGQDQQQKEMQDQMQIQEQELSEADEKKAAYYRKLAGDIKENLLPQDVSAIINGEDISLEQLYDRQQAEAVDRSETAYQGEQTVIRQMEMAYLKEQAAEIRMAAEVSEEAVTMLTSYDMPATPDYLTAADRSLQDRGSMVRQVKQQAEYLDEKEEQRGVPVENGGLTGLLEDAIEDIKEHFTDSVSAKEAYEHLADRMEEILTVSSEEQDSRIQLKEISLAWKQISVARNLSREENYEIPMEIGDQLTSVNVCFRHNSRLEENVTITMDTEEFGKVSAFFEGEEISGYIVCEKQAGIEWLKSRQDAFTEEMQAKGMTVSEIKFIQSDRLDINNFAREADENNRTRMSSAKLYETAKTFMQSFMKA